MDRSTIKPIKIGTRSTTLNPGPVSAATVGLAQSNAHADVVVTALHRASVTVAHLHAKDAGLGRGWHPQWKSLLKVGSEPPQSAHFILNFHEFSQ